MTFPLGHKLIIKIKYDTVNTKMKNYGGIRVINNCILNENHNK